ncbi:MAG: hypothetical protein Kow0092_35360 [Deferrisomatales bacterium]
MVRLSAALCLSALLCGCAALLSSATGRLAADFARGVLNQDDLETVRDGAPAYLLMIDGLVEGDPDDPELLLTGAKIYGAYASAFVDDPVRARRLALKAKEYALRAACARGSPLCEAADQPFEVFEAAAAAVPRRDVDVLYGLAAAWAGWIQASPGDYDALADLPKIEALMRQAVTLDETYDHGGAHLYLGVLAALRPPQLGGRPQEARAHFERVISLSAGRHLMAKVLYAQHYARLVFDRELHDRLLEEVLEAEPRQPGLTLSNVLAQRKAAALLADSETYFE